MPVLADLNGALLVARLRFARAQRRKRRHLWRFLLTGCLVFICWGVLSSAYGQSPSGYRGMASSATASLVLPLAAYSLILAFLAGGELSGPERQQRLALVTLSEIGPGSFLFGLWLAVMAHVALLWLSVLPALAALSLVGGADAETLTRLGLALGLSVGLVSALGLALSLGAGSPAMGLARTVALTLGLPVVLAVAAEIGPLPDSSLEFLLRCSPLLFLDDAAPLASPSHLFQAVGSTLALIALLLVAARRRLVGQFSTAPPKPRPTSGLLERIAGVLHRGERKTTPGTRPLDWLCLDVGRRTRQGAQLLWLAAVLLVTALVFWHEGWKGLVAEEFLGILTLLMGLASVAMVLAAPMLWWSKLSRRGLAGVLLATPLESWSYLRASLRASLATASYPLLAFLSMLVVLGLTNDVPASRQLPALAALMPCLILLALLGVGIGMISRKSSSTDFTAESLLVVVLGAPVLAALLGFSEALQRSDLLSQSAMPDLRVVLILVLGALVLPVSILARRTRHPRLTLLVPALLVGLSWPALGYLLDADEAPWLLNPLAILFAASIEAATGAVSRGGGLGDLRWAAVVGMTLAAGLFLCWSWYRFDDLVDR